MPLSLRISFLACTVFPLFLSAQEVRYPYPHDSLWQARYESVRPGYPKRPLLEECAAVYGSDSVGAFAPRTNLCDCYFLAAAEGRTDMLRMLWKQGANLNLRQSQRLPLSLLHFACRYGQRETAVFLLDEVGIPVEDKEVTERGVRFLGTPLMEACELGDSVMAKLLIQRGANINNASGRMSRRPLSYAMYSRNEALAIWLIDQGADPFYCHFESSCSYEIACSTGMLKVADRIFKNHPINVNQIYPFPCGTMLGAASGQGNIEAIRFLLRLGANPNIAERDWWPFCRPPLAQAVLNGRMEAARVLLEAGANPNIISGGHFRTETPILFSLLRRGFFEESRLIIQYGAKVSNEAITGLSPLFALVCSRIQSKPPAYRRSRNKFDLSARTLAMRSGLCEKPVDFGDEEQSATPTPPDSFCVVFDADNYYEILNLLIAKGADVNALAPSGIGLLETCRILEKEYGLPMRKTIQILKAAGITEHPRPRIPSFKVLKNLEAYQEISEQFIPEARPYPKKDLYKAPGYPTQVAEWLFYWPIDPRPN